MAESSSSSSKGGASVTQPRKKRRMQAIWACNRCRAKKIRCDGKPYSDSTKCTNCRASGADCVFSESTTTWGASRRYEEDIESRLNKMENLLSRLDRSHPPAPNARDDLLAQVRGEGSVEHESPASSNSHSSPPAFPIQASDTQDIAVDDAHNSDDDSLGSQTELVNQLRQMSIDPSAPRFFGKSSGVTLVRSTMEAKLQACGFGHGIKDPTAMTSHTRPEFWGMSSWEMKRALPYKKIYAFPEGDLLSHLISLYFQHVAPLLPLLHRPTFMEAIEDGLHLRHCGFGAVVLLVCATASRYSDDPRVLVEGSETGRYRHSAGYQWYDQVTLFPNSALAHPDLYHVQTTVLAAAFSHGSASPQEGWVAIGVGLRLAQDVAAHRRRQSHAVPTIEEELWRRAFWSLVMLDVWLSSELGRPCAITEESYDADPPIECDDEYWENSDPQLAFRQPPGRPSLVSFFNRLIKLTQLQSYALRTIYSLKAREVTGPRAKGWEERAVTSLDSALNSWFGNLPDHLRWNPAQEDTTFLMQSAYLHATYYHIQIMIHRAFIPSPQQQPTLSLPSLIICTAAARSCSHVAADIHRRLMRPMPPLIQLSVFYSGVILSLRYWSARRTVFPLDLSEDIRDIQSCLQLIEISETRWSFGCRLKDILLDVAAVGDLPTPEGPMVPNETRRDGADRHPQPQPQPVLLSDSNIQRPAFSHVALHPTLGPEQRFASISHVAPDRGRLREDTSTGGALYNAATSELHAAGAQRDLNGLMSMQPPFIAASRSQLEVPHLDRHGQNNPEERVASYRVMQGDPLRDNVARSSNSGPSVFNTGLPPPDDLLLGDRPADAFLLNHLGVMDQPPGILDVNPDSAMRSKPQAEIDSETLAVWSVMPWSFESGTGEWSEYASNLPWAASGPSQRPGS